MLHSLFKTDSNPAESAAPRTPMRLLNACDGGDRRRKPRINGPFPAVVRGVDAGGETFEVYTVVENICARGLYLRLNQRLEPGTTLYCEVTLSAPVGTVEAAPRLALHGMVLRAELKPCGACGVAVAFTHHRFLYAAEVRRLSAA